MKYTVRFAHLEERPKYKVGDEIKQLYHLGTIGNTGKSTGKHLHLDGCKGEQLFPWHLYDIDNGKIQFDSNVIIQLNYFLDSGLFADMTTPAITTPLCDLEYKAQFGKWHWGFDVVPDNRKDYNIFWNRTKIGEVVYNDFTEGYGNLLMICYEA